jgi:hypothetical protein
MLKNYKKKMLIFNYFLLLCTIILIIVLIIRIHKNETKFFLAFNINDIFQILSFLIFFNYSHKIGMILSIISFFIYIIIIVLFLPERILNVSTFIRLIACGIIIHQVSIMDKRNKKNGN